MRILLGAWIAAMPVLALMAASADAADIPIARARLHLAVNIPRVVSLTLLDHPHSVDVSPEDVARGFVRVRGSLVDILCNNRGGCELRAQLSGAAFESVELAVLPVAGSPRRGRAAVEYVLRLARGTSPGPQPWPVALALEAP